MVEITKKAKMAMTDMTKIRHSRLNMASLDRCLRCERCRMVPFRETMIHMRKAVRVKERGKIINMTTRRAADCIYQLVISVMKPRKLICKQRQRTSISTCTTPIE